MGKCKVYITPHGDIIGVDDEGYVQEGLGPLELGSVGEVEADCCCDWTFSVIKIVKERLVLPAIVGDLIHYSKTYNRIHPDIQKEIDEINKHGL